MAVGASSDSAAVESASETVPSASEAAVRDLLSGATLADDLAALGLPEQDRDDTERLVATLAADDSPAGEAARARAVRGAAELTAALGHFARPGSRFGSMAEEAYPVPGIPGRGLGTVALVSLLATVQQVRDYHRSRGIDAATSSWALDDLAGAIAAHRRVHGEYGLHTHEWLALVWSGALYRIGRLVFNLHAEAGTEPTRWLIATHIPRRGSFGPAEVDEAFAAASTFFATHFPDHPADEFSCSSWLLDPRVNQLGQASNLASFQRRWRLLPGDTDGTTSVRYFVWDRADEVDLDLLPADTSLRRLIIEEWRSGRSWRNHSGRIAIAPTPSAP